MGVIFPERYEEAYSGLQLAQGFGVVVVFCLFYVSMLTKIYVMLFSCIIALAFYVALEIWLLKRKKSCRLVITVDSTWTVATEFCCLGNQKDILLKCFVVFGVSDGISFHGLYYCSVVYSVYYTVTKYVHMFNWQSSCLKI